MPTTAAKPKRRSHCYESVGTTYAVPRDCTKTGYMVDYSPRTRRCRVEYRTSWAGDRTAIWYLDDRSREDADAILARLREPDGREFLGEPDWKGPRIR